MSNWSLANGRGVGHMGSGAREFGVMGMVMGASLGQWGRVAFMMRQWEWYYASCIYDNSPFSQGKWWWGIEVMGHMGSGVMGVGVMGMVTGASLGQWGRAAFMVHQWEWYYASCVYDNSPFSQGKWRWASEGPLMSFILKGSQILSFQLKG